MGKFFDYLFGATKSFSARLEPINEDESYPLHYLPAPSAIADTFTLKLMNQPLFIGGNTCIDYETLPKYKNSYGKLVHPNRTEEFIFARPNFGLAKAKSHLNKLTQDVQKKKLTDAQKLEIEKEIATLRKQIEFFNIQEEIRKQTEEFVATQEKLYGLYKNGQMKEYGNELILFYNKLVFQICAEKNSKVYTNIDIQELQKAFAPAFAKLSDEVTNYFPELAERPKLPIVNATPKLKNMSIVEILKVIGDMQKQEKEPNQLVLANNQTSLLPPEILFTNPALKRIFNLSANVFRSEAVLFSWKKSYLDRRLLHSKKDQTHAKEYQCLVSPFSRIL